MLIDFDPHTRSMRVGKTQAALGSKGDEILVLSTTATTKRAERLSPTYREFAVNRVLSDLNGGSRVGALHTDRMRCVDRADQERHFEASLQRERGFSEIGNLQKRIGKKSTKCRVRNVAPQHEHSQI